MLVTPQRILQQIVVEDGRNQLVNAKQVLHLYQRQFAAQMEKLLQQFPSQVLLNALVANLVDFMQRLSLLQLSVSRNISNKANNFNR
jgi:hypothetical protein